CEVKYRPLARLPLGPHLAAVAPDYPLHRCQADAETSLLLGSREALEWDKEFVRIRHIESGAVVPDITGPFAVNLHCAELDERFLPYAGVFPGVAEEVIEDHPQQVPIPVYGKSVGNPERDPALRLAQLQFHSNLLRHDGKVNHFPAQLDAGQAGEVEQDVDKL